MDRVYRAKTVRPNPSRAPRSRWYSPMNVGSAQRARPDFVQLGGPPVYVGLVLRMLIVTSGLYLAGPTACFGSSEPESRRPSVVIDKFRGPIDTIKFSPDGKSVAAADQSFSVRLFDLT